MMIRALLTLLGMLLASSTLAGGTDISPSDVYAQVLQVEKETELIRRHFKITAQPAPSPVHADLLPRHVWQKSYMVLVQINVFRRRHGLITIAPVGIEPLPKLDSHYTWAQAQRILTEIRIVRKLLGIAGDVGVAPQVAGKRPIDVFNKLDEVSRLWDTLSGAELDASLTYAEAIRINDDIEAVLHQLHISDTALPPPKRPDATPKDALDKAFVLMDGIQRLQRVLGIETVDFGVFRKSENVTAADVFNMTGMALAEFQLVKAKIGLHHAITPPATYQEGKKPSDVAQVLGYAASKLTLIQRL